MKMLAIALIVALTGLFSIACKRPDPKFIPSRCEAIVLPPLPRLPIQDVPKEGWTKDQWLDAYAKSTVILTAWHAEVRTLINAHNSGIK